LQVLDGALGTVAVVLDLHQTDHVGVEALRAPMILVRWRSNSAAELAPRLVGSRRCHCR
jgi:hypothetical protein